MMDSDREDRRRYLPVIAIDGPAGSGKSTVARVLAERLGFVTVDTGALYRGVALIARERGISWGDESALGALVGGIVLGFSRVADGPPRLMIDGQDRSGDIRTPEISMGASEVSKHTAVRTALLRLQRRIGEGGGVVLEGRDIGTVVFPNADIKFFLVADTEIRAERRRLDLLRAGISADFADIFSDLIIRDQQDRSRSAAPLRSAEDAIIVDTSELSIEQVVAHLVSIVLEKERSNADCTPHSANP